MKKVRNLLALFRMTGPAWLLERAVQRILPSRYAEFHRFLLIEQRAANFDFSVARRPGMRWATPEDIDSSGSLGFEPEACRRLFERGALARVLEEDGRIIAYAWAEVSRATLMGIDFDCEPTEIFGTLAVTVPDRRGEGIQKALVLDLCRELICAQGYERILGEAASLNRRALHTVKKIPSIHVLGTIFVLRLGNRCLIHDKAGVLIPADGGGRGRHWITSRGRLEAKVGPGELAT